MDLNWHTSNGTNALPSVAPLREEFIIAGSISLIIGKFGVFSNVINVIVIRRTKTMHTPCFSLIVAHAWVCWFMAVSFITNAIHYLGLATNILTANYSMITCNLIYTSSTCSSPASAVMSFLIALERLWAIALPIGYKNKSRFITKLVTFIAVASGLAFASAAVLTTPRPWSQQVQCYNMFSGLHAGYSVLFTYFNLAFSILGVLCYVFVYPLIVWKKNREATATAEQTHFFRRQLKLLPMVNALVIAYGVFGAGPPLIASTSSIIANGIYLKRASLYVLILKSAVPCIDFCVMIFKCKDFAVGTKTLFKVFTLNHVHPFGQTASR